MLYGLLGLIILVLVILLTRKKVTEAFEEHQLRDNLQKEVENLRLEKEHLDDILDQRDETIRQADIHCQETIDKLYKKSIETRNELTKLDEARREEIENNYKTLVAAKRELYIRECKDLENEIYNEWSIMIDRHEANKRMLQNQEEIIAASIQKKQDIYNSVIQPLKLLEQKEQEKVFWCLQIPESNQEDIHYLISAVAPRVHSKDIIPKLVWSEYVQRPAQDLMRRAEIEDTPGIYKITNIRNGKCYVGKSTKVRQRLIDHIKGAIGISSIADQVIHHAMMDEGLWNWTFEKICDCEKDELNEKEKYYIDFFKATEYGYNIRSGG